MTKKEFFQKILIVVNLLEKEKMFKDIYAGFILGKPQFIKDTLDELKIQVEGDEVSYKDKLQLSRSIDDIVEEVARGYKKTKEELYKGKRRSFIDRKISVYIITECTNYTHKEIEKKFGISSGAVGKIASDIERLMNKDNKLYRDIKSLNSYFEV